nr:flippase-like domain-containing protein [Actinomycetes bacterium]
MAPRPSRALQRLLVGAVSLALATVLLVVVLPEVTGAAWVDIWAELRRLTPAQVTALTALWLVGVVAFSWVLTGALPGLTHGQAVTMNLAGSAVSNVVPFGGALGVAVSYAMARSFGFRRSSFGLFAAVTGLFIGVAKLALPLLGLLGLLATGRLPTRRLVLIAGLGAAALAVLTVAVVGALTSDRIARGVSRAVDTVGGVVLRLVRSPRTLDSGRVIVDLRDRSADLIRHGWPSMTAGLAGFFGIQALLLWTILQMLGGTLGPTEVFAGFALGRLLSAAVVTPGGVGIAETGAAGLLVALGGDPAVSAAGVLLLSGYTYLIEIPAGAVSTLVWWWRRSWRRP